MPDPNAPMPPILFGKYRLIKKLAQGGMAEIYVAKSTGAGGFEKTVIVKKILPRLSAHDKFVRMFINEAKVSSVLNHSNVVQIFDFGRVGQDYFIAMEYVDGKDLRSIIRSCRERARKIPMEFVLYTGVQVTKALEYAHTRCDADGVPMGLVHRDVSPQNVLLSRQGEIKLTDFGIAKAMESGGLSETVANEIKGNFGYMPPEQAAGQPLDSRTDVYATAMVLYELCALKNPFADTNLLAVIQRIKEMVPPPPSSFNPAVSRSVDQILLKGLEKNPQDRFASAGEMCAALSEELFPSPSELVQASFAAFLNSLFPPELPPSRPAATPPPGAPPRPDSWSGAEKEKSKSSRWGAGPMPSQEAQPRVLARRSAPAVEVTAETGPGIVEEATGRDAAARRATDPPAPAPARRPTPSPSPAPARRPTPSPAPSSVRGSTPPPVQPRAPSATPLPVNGAPTSPDSDLRFARKIRDLANLARLRLDVAPANVEVFIDEHKISSGAPIEIQTSAKVEHRLELRAEGFSDFATTFVLSPGEIRDFQIVLAERTR